MKVYVVTSDEYNQSYGSEIYLIGVFDRLALAEEAKKECKYAKITEAEINGSMYAYLGGYIE